MKMTKKQRRIVRTMSFPVVSFLLMTVMMAIAGTH